MDEGVRAASEPRNEDTTIEDMLRFRLVEKIGDTQALKNKVAMAYDPHIPANKPKSDNFKNTSSTGHETDPEDAILRVQQLVASEKASELLSSVSRLETERSGLQKAIEDAFWPRFAIVIEGVAKVECVARQVGTGNLQVVVPRIR
jgi:hypothetical protein